jgi:hypothetical protein
LVPAAASADYLGKVIDPVIATIDQAVNGGFLFELERRIPVRTTLDASPRDHRGTMQPSIGMQLIQDERGNVLSRYASSMKA